MEKNKKIIIIGNGFRAMMSAYMCSKISKDVSIVTNTENIHGIMSPLEWRGGNFDKGYQFFDGLTNNDRKILEDFVGENVFHNFGYGASTFTNFKIYERHGIPYWPHYGFFFSTKAFIELIFLGCKKDLRKVETYNDLLQSLPKSIKNILEKACYRNTNLKSDEVSHIVSCFSPFLHFRQTLLPEKISYYLKKLKFFDKRLACRRRILKLDEISLYPKGKYIGFVSKKMQNKLLQIGTKFLISKNAKISIDNSKLSVKIDGQTLNPDHILMVAELDDILTFFDEKISEERNNHYVSQIFIFFSVRNVISKYQYIHCNDINFLINRVNNLSLYGEKTSEGEKVISVEIPTKINSAIWNDPEKYLGKVWGEVKSMKMISEDEKFINHKIFKIPKTVSIPLKNFENSKKKLEELAKLKYENKVLFPGLGEITRKKFLDSLNFYIKNL